jgi:hypothetical protein
VAVAALVACLFAAPLAYLALRGLAEAGTLAAASASGATLGPLARTPALGVSVAGASAVLGTALAWLAPRTDLPGRRAAGLLLLPLPLMMPSFIAALVSVFLPVAARLGQLPASLEERARLLGRGPAAVFRTLEAARGPERGPASLETAREAKPRARSREAPRYRGNESALRSPGAARVWWAMVVVGMLAFAAAAAGIAVSATHGTRTTADEPQYLLTAISLAEDRDLDIGDELADGRWRPFHALPLPEQTEPLAGGRRLSPHDPLLPLLLAGPVAVGGWVGAKLAMAAMAGLLAALALWTAVRRLGVPIGTAALAVGVFACSPPMAVYGSQVYPELPAALAVLAAVAALLSPAATGGRATLVVGGAVAALPWLGVKYAPVAAVIALVACWRLVGAGRGRRALVLAGSLATAGVAFLVLHRWWYGGWTPYAVGDHFVQGELSVVGAEPDYLGRSRRLVGLLVDRGLRAGRLAAGLAAGRAGRRRPGQAPSRRLGRPGRPAGRRLAGGHLRRPDHARLVVRGPPGGGRPAPGRAGRGLVDRPRPAPARTAGPRRRGRGAGPPVAGRRGRRRAGHLGGGPDRHRQPAVPGLAAGPAGLPGHELEDLGPARGLADRPGRLGGVGRRGWTSSGRLP